MVQETRPEHGRRAGRIRARFVFTLIGAAALVVGAFLDWTQTLAGNKVTLRSLVENDFHTRSSLPHTVAAVSVLIAIVAVLSLLDPTGWLTRLTGFAGIVLFAMFAIQVYRHNGQDVTTAVRALRPGAWLQLGGGVVLLAGGMVRYRRRRGRIAPAAVTDETITHAKIATGDAPESASATAASPKAEAVAEQPDRERATWTERLTGKSTEKSTEKSAEEQREELEPDTTVFRPPTPSEIGVGARSAEDRDSAPR